MSQKQRSLLEGNPIKCILLFAIPIFFGNLFQIMYSLIDTKIVGGILGEHALAAVGSVSTLYNLLTGFFNGLTMGFSVIVARHFGSGDQEKLKKSVAATITLGFTTVAVIVIGVMIGLRPVLQFLNVPEAQLGMSYAYIRILILGMFVTLAYNICANCLRAIGDSLTPLVFLVIASVANVILDYLFILGGKMGVEGAAYATVLAQFLSVFLCLIRIWKSFPILHVGRKEFVLEKELVLQMYQSGLSMGFMSCFVNFGTLILQTGINMLGTTIIVAHTAARKVFEIWVLPITVLGAAMATYCSQNYGAKNYERIRTGLKSTLLLGTAWSVVVFIMAHTISAYLIKFIASTKNEEIIYWGKTYLEYDMSFLVVCAFIVILRNSMQGFGDYKTPVFSSFIELVGKIVFSFTFVKMAGYWGIIWAEPVIWFLMVLPLIFKTFRNQQIFPRKLQQ
ncbi:MAG: MATE family efflux transporter [Roseburia sp.]